MDTIHKERFVEEIEDHGEWVLTRTIKEVWHKKEELEADCCSEVSDEELEQRVNSLRTAWEKCSKSKGWDSC